jgi:hypothetical protein
MANYPMILPERGRREMYTASVASKYLFSPFSCVHYVHVPRKIMVILTMSSLLLDPLKRRESFPRPDYLKYLLKCYSKSFRGAVRNALT